MKLLIDCTYFCKGERHIQNAPITTAPEDQNEIAVMDTIDGFIEDNQGFFFESMLGKTLATNLQSYLDSKWQAEEEGDEFDEDEELEYIADGIAESFADYVFYKILRYTMSLSTTTGLVELKTANNYRNPADKQASIWNRMVSRNRKFFTAAMEELADYTIYFSENMVTPINAINI